MVQYAVLFIIVFLSSFNSISASTSNLYEYISWLLNNIWILRQCCRIDDCSSRQYTYVAAID